MESLVDMIGLFSLHFMTYYKRRLGKKAQLSLGGTGQQAEHCQESVFRTPRHSLLRDQIFSLIGKGFYLSSREEVIGLMPSRVVLPGDL